MAWKGKKSRINIRVIMNVSMGLVIFHSICYLYISRYSKKGSATEKHLIPEISKVKMDAYDDDWIKKMEEKYRKDNERIRKVCNKYRTVPLFASNNSDEIHKSIVMHMPIDVTHRLAHCPNGKVATYFEYRIGININIIFGINETIL